MAWDAEKQTDEELAADGLRSALFNYFDKGFTLKDCEEQARGCWKAVKNNEQRIAVFCALRGIGQ